jgi:hypothetical protein
MLGALLAFEHLFPAHQQTDLPEGIWKVLSGVTWPKPDNAAADFSKPQFSSQIKALNGTRITISGYLIPTDLYSSTHSLIISAYPVQNCFFCGGAGLESVIEVYPAKKANYLMKKLTFRGTLVLNETDPQHMIYQLKNAERVFGDE